MPGDKEFSFGKLSCNLFSGGKILKNICLKEVNSFFFEEVTTSLILEYEAKYVIYSLGVNTVEDKIVLKIAEGDTSGPRLGHCYDDCVALCPRKRFLLRMSNSGQIIIHDLLTAHIFHDVLFAGLTNNSFRLGVKFIDTYTFFVVTPTSLKLYSYSQESVSWNPFFSTVHDIIHWWHDPEQNIILLAVRINQDVSNILVYGNTPNEGGGINLLLSFQIPIDMLTSLEFRHCVELCHLYGQLACIFIDKKCMQIIVYICNTATKVVNELNYPICHDNDFCLLVQDNLIMTFDLAKPSCNLYDIRAESKQPLFVPTDAAANFDFLEKHSLLKKYQLSPAYFSTKNSVFVHQNSLVISVKAQYVLEIIFIGGLVNTRRWQLQWKELITCVYGSEIKSAWKLLLNRKGEVLNRPSEELEKKAHGDIETKQILLNHLCTIANSEEISLSAIRVFFDAINEVYISALKNCIAQPNYFRQIWNAPDVSERDDPPYHIAQFMENVHFLRQSESRIYSLSRTPDCALMVLQKDILLFFLFQLYIVKCKPEKLLTILCDYLASLYTIGVPIHSNILTFCTYTLRVHWRDMHVQQLYQYHVPTERLNRGLIFQNDQNLSLAMMQIDFDVCLRQQQILRLVKLHLVQGRIHSAMQLIKRNLGVCNFSIAEQLFGSAINYLRHNCRLRRTLTDDFALNVLFSVYSFFTVFCPSAIERKVTSLFTQDKQILQPGYVGKGSYISHLAAIFPFPIDILHSDKSINMVRSMFGYMPA